METKDHLTLAKLIISNNEKFDKSNKKMAFETGCISPDINLTTYIKGHTYSATIDYVKRTISKLSSKLRSTSDFFELGRAVHFIGDYFTFPHSPKFTGTLKEHVEYESILHRYISEISFSDYKKAENFQRFKLTKCTELIDAAQNKYLGMKNSVQTDWMFIQFICSEVTLALTCKNTAALSKKSGIRPAYGSI